MLPVGPSISCSRRLPAVHMSAGSSAFQCAQAAGLFSLPDVLLLPGSAALFLSAGIGFAQAGMEMCARLIVLHSSCHVISQTEPTTSKHRSG